MKKYLRRKKILKSTSILCTLEIPLRRKMETNKFYIVRAMGKDSQYEVRHSDNPDLVWARVDSVEDGQERIKELQLDWQIDMAVIEFIGSLEKKLEVDGKTLRDLVKRCL